MQMLQIPAAKMAFPRPALVGQMRRTADKIRVFSSKDGSIEQPDVRKLAQLAQIGVTDKEVYPAYRLVAINSPFLIISPSSPSPTPLPFPFSSQVAEWGPQIASIVDWFGQLQQVDVEGVPPTLRADIEGETPLRSDQAVDFQDKKAMIKQAPDSEGSFVRVPKIATAADNN
jgi:aspartyl-tRNA(Asn)/glutamyl-tRNA(Gln) amidotransferase subunit C